jgi:hypothetical protein
MLKPNEGKIERYGRVIAGIVVFGLAFAPLISGAWFWVALVVSALLIITGATGICPLYTAIGWAIGEKDYCPTCPREELSQNTSQ